MTERKKERYKERERIKEETIFVRARKKGRKEVVCDGVKKKHYRLEGKGRVVRI